MTTWGCCQDGHLEGAGRILLPDYVRTSPLSWCQAAIASQVPNSITDINSRRNFIAFVMLLMRACFSSLYQCSAIFNAQGLPWVPSC